jgi:hypothetical protein
VQNLKLPYRNIEKKVIYSKETTEKSIFLIKNNSVKRNIIRADK